ncbi:MAG: chaperone NapD [Nitrospirae bacterium]|nr:chaperone NapD [Nitrospirota bacterium]
MSRPFFSADIPDGSKYRSCEGTGEHGVRRMIGLIVKAEHGTGEELVRELSNRAHVSVQRVQGSQIALLLDSDDMHVIARSSREIQDMKGVVSVYPVFSEESFPF